MSLLGLPVNEKMVASAKTAPKGGVRKRRPAGPRCSEAALQRDCVAWLRHVELLHFSNAAGAHLAGNAKQRAIQSAKLKASGTSNGFPDLFILASSADGRGGLGVELKVKKNTLTAEQEKWQADLRTHGFGCEVARSLEEFKKIVGDYMEGTTG